MKRIVVVMMCICLLLPILGCGDNDSDSGSGNKKKDRTEREEQVDNDKQINNEKQDDLPLISDLLSTDTDLSTAEIGDVVCFGQWDYHVADDDGIVPCEWDVLDMQDGKMLLISHYVLEDRVFSDDDSHEAASWEQSTIREYLNNEMINTLFTDAEKQKILPVIIQNPSIDRYYDIYEPDGYHNVTTDTYNVTEDRLFLLSWEELVKYYGPLEYCDPATDGVYIKGYYATRAIASYKGLDTDGYVWWLRTIGEFDFQAMTVGYDGFVK